MRKGIIFLGEEPGKEIADFFSNNNINICVEKDIDIASKWLDFACFEFVFILKDGIAESYGQIFKNQIDGGAWFLIPSDFEKIPGLTGIPNVFEIDMSRAEKTLKKIFNLKYNDPHSQFSYLYSTDLCYHLLENAPSAVIIINEAGNILIANYQTTKMFGYTHAELTDRKIEMLLPEEFRKIHVKQRKKFAKAPEARSMAPKNEYLNALRKDGSTFVADISISGLVFNNRKFFACSINDITENVQNIQSLVERERYINDIIALIPGAFYQSTILPDGQRKVIYISEGIRKLFDMSESDLISDYEKYFMRIHPDDAKMMRKISDNAFANLLPFELEYRFYAQNGESYKWIYTKATPYTKDGENYVWNGTLTDVTHLHKAEELIKIQKRVLESAKVGILIIIPDPDFSSRVVEFANEEFYKMTGYSPEEIIGQNPLQTISRHNSAKEINIIRESVMNGKVFNDEINIYKKDGSPIWCHVIITPVTNENNIISHFIGIINDISEKKNIELQREHDLLVFNSVIRNMHNGLLIVDNNFNPIAVNPVFCRIFGYKFPEEVIPEQIFSPEYSKNKVIDPEKFVERLKLIKTERKPVYNEEIKLKNGQFFERDYIPVFSADHTFIGHMIQYHNVTLLKKAEYLLRTQNDDLVKINSELDRFIYSMSHELNGPLTSIRGLVNMAETGITNKDQLQILRLINYSLDRIDFFIKNIIIYHENNKTEIEPEEINLFELIDETILKVNDFMKSQIEVRVTGDERYPYIGDKSRLTVVLSNLISNAIIFTDKEKRNPHLSINANCTMELAEIIIKDNGIGIHQNEFDKIFQMFYRGSELSTGTGLGLYIVKEIIQKLNGKIIIKSTAGRGTTVKIIVPNLIVNRN